MSSYRDLRVWQEAVDLAVVVYAATEDFPRREQFGLANQLRRAAVSISSNIAEGKGRGTDRDYCHFLYIARGSVLELQTQIEIALRLKFLAPEDGQRLAEKADALGRGLNSLIRSLEKQLESSAKALR